jgi:hypothetical protein
MQEQSTTPEQVAWAAGLFEGEGCWNAYRRESGKIQMQARLGMTDRDVVERFAQIVGYGSIHVAKPLHTWCVYEAEKVREVIALFLPLHGRPPPRKGRRSLGCRSGRPRIERQEDALPLGAPVRGRQPRHRDSEGQAR